MKNIKIRWVNPNFSFGEKEFENTTIVVAINEIIQCFKAMEIISIEVTETK